MTPPPPPTPSQCKLQSAHVYIYIVYEPATGGLVHRSTGAYTACTVCNLHCVLLVEVVVVVVVAVVYIQSQTVYLHSGGYPSCLHTVPGNEC